MSRDADAALFGLPANATRADLKRAYRQAALTLHPDQNSDPAAAAKFRELTDAYNRLLRMLALAPIKKRTPQDRVAWLVADARDLLRRWSAERWQVAVDGLPAAVWLFSTLDVLAHLWTPPGPLPASASITDLAACLETWPAWLQTHPLPRQSRTAAKSLGGALDAAESRIQALSRPRRARRQ